MRVTNFFKPTLLLLLVLLLDRVVAQDTTTTTSRPDSDLFVANNTGDACSQGWQCSEGGPGLYSSCVSGSCQCNYGFTGSPCSCGSEKQVSWLNDDVSMCLQPLQCNHNWECPPLPTTTTGLCMATPSRPATQPFVGTCFTDFANNTEVPCNSSWNCWGLFSRNVSCQNGVCKCGFGFSGEPDSCGPCEDTLAWVPDVGYFCLSGSQCVNDKVCDYAKTGKHCVIPSGSIVGNCKKIPAPNATFPCLDLTEQSLSYFSTPDEPLVSSSSNDTNTTEISSVVSLDKSSSRVGSHAVRVFIPTVRDTAEAVISYDNPTPMALDHVDLFYFIIRFAVDNSSGLETRNAIGVQGAGPKIVLVDMSGYEKTLTPINDYTPSKTGTWVRVQVPIFGSTNWTVATETGFNISEVTSFDMIFTPLEGNFFVDLDAMVFDNAAVPCKIACNSDCNGRGKCNKTFVCACDKAYAGDDCENCASGYAAVGDVCSSASSLTSWLSLISFL